MKSIGYYIIGSAIIWGAVIVLCALTLKEDFSRIAIILNGAAGIHLIFIWGPLAAQLKKKKDEDKSDSEMD